ncbi:Hypothetical predicted protein [Drosophila guanche]|uniref:Uncharacterized protein n=2 Tax=Drosophila guanche TaxID=7266 RepID=A0A3B0JFU4_DROGU|nr:Hypothetical predicted protein [Drosophila guanche]
MSGILILLFCISCASVAASPTAARRAQLHDDVQLIHPHIITLERLENLLRRAGEIFAPAIAEDSMSEGSSHVEQQAQPQQLLLPPTAQPYNFYLPLFDYVDPKLDAKSRLLEKIAPPPQPLKQEHNYYADKPKKKPKKFNAASKHINLNLKWLNTYEKAMGGETPKALYLEQDERNRINFDDSFFAADMQVKMPDNQPHQEAGPAELLQHGEEQAEEDLMAAPAQITYDYKSTGQDQHHS